VCWKNVAFSLFPFTPKAQRGVAVLDSKTGAGFVILAAIANASFALPRPLQLHVAGIALLVFALFLLSRVNA
jgi:hypothetical protein